MAEKSRQETEMEAASRDVQQGDSPRARNSAVERNASRGATGEPSDEEQEQRKQLLSEINPDKARADKNLGRTIGDPDTMMEAEGKSPEEMAKNATYAENVENGGKQVKGDEELKKIDELEKKREAAQKQAAQK